MEKINSITVLGRRWFCKGLGNTYHSAQILVNGKTVHKIGFMYGGMNQYLYNAFTWLEDNKYLPERKRVNGGYESPWSTAERLGFHLEYEASDVLRKKDL